MTRTVNDRTGTARTAWGERAVVLGGFALAGLCTAWLAATGACPGPVPGSCIETVAAAWLAAGAWAFLSSLALALRRGIRDRDWSPFRRHELPDNRDAVDWSTKTGAYAWMRIAEENERLMRGD